VSSEEQGRPARRTLADIYADRALTQAQVRRIVALLRLTERPTEHARPADAEAA